jgi:hypothetical protein
LTAAQVAPPLSCPKPERSLSILRWKSSARLLVLGIRNNLQEEPMRSHDLTYDVGRAVRVGIVALGLVALTVPSVIILSSPDAFARGGGGGGKGGGDKGGLSGGVSGGIGGDLGSGLSGSLGGSASVGAGAGSGGVGAGAGAGVGGVGGAGAAAGGSSPAAGGGPGVGGPDPSGGGATDGSSISAAFETLSAPQQARVMQRCKDVVARPELSDPTQLTICRTLMTMARP